MPVLALNVIAAAAGHAGWNCMTGFVCKLTH